ncbi:hypothetical protein AUK22_02930 [bacterium CG2_30_54_10]|nr:MAG: hypothetical protein AUK22_02930 [bacterium CG2_30_54_10]
MLRKPGKSPLIESWMGGDPRRNSIEKIAHLLNNSGKLNDSWRKRFPPSAEMTASFVIPNECEESRFMLRIS